MISFQEGDLNRLSVSVAKAIFCTLIVPGEPSDSNNVHCHTAYTTTARLVSVCKISYILAVVC